jgi:hypothetical protein
MSEDTATKPESEIRYATWREHIRTCPVCAVSMSRCTLERELWASYRRAA